MAESQKGPGLIKQSLPLDARGNPLRSSDYTPVLAASGQLITGACILDSLLIATGGTNNATVELFDGTADTADELTPAMLIPGADSLGGFANLGIRVTNGVYAKITSVGGAQVQGYFNR